MADIIEAEKAYNQFLPEAQQVPAEEILPYRLDPDVAIINIDTAILVIVAHKAEIADHLPKENLGALLSLPQLARGTLFAALDAEQLAPVEKNFKKTMAEAQSLRKRLLQVVQGFAGSELVPQHEVDAIVAGRGARDMAEDCISLAKLFRRYEKVIDGKHTLDATIIDRTAAVGSHLISLMDKSTEKTTATRKKAVDPAPEVDLRNRFGTLLVKRHERLRAVAHYFHPTDWEKRAPALMSRSVKREVKRATAAEKKDDPQ